MSVSRKNKSSIRTIDITEGKYKIKINDTKDKNGEITEIKEEKRKEWIGLLGLLSFYLKV